MEKKKIVKKADAEDTRKVRMVTGAGVCSVLFIVYLVGFADIAAVTYSANASSTAAAALGGEASSTGAVNGVNGSNGSGSGAAVSVPPLDKALYDSKMLFLAHTTLASSTATSTKAKLWPVKNLPYPLPGAILPFKRIIAYYGNFYSTRMGVLGEYSTDVVKQKLRAEMARWEKADPTTPTIPAINYIATTAQATAGADGKYRLRMPDAHIDRAVTLADQMDGIVILDIQIGLSDIMTETKVLEKYLKMPEVHLGLDPEFSMKTGAKPGTVIGSMSAKDINSVAQYLAKLVRENNLPPKVLVIHRFTQAMVTNYKDIKPLPEVQIVMDMDGWGSQAKKIGTYTHVVAPEPVQFTGFKLFYKNDLKPPSTGLLTPAEILKLTPSPSFIQYQ